MFDICFQAPYNLLWIFFTLFIVIFIITIVKRKKKDNDKAMQIALTTLYSISVVSSVIAATKIIKIDVLIISDEMYVPAGVIIYAASFLITDIISEVYGKKEAKFAVWIGFVSMVIFTFYSLLMMYWEAAPYWQNQESYESVVSPSFWITGGGIISFIVSQYCDVHIFHWLKNDNSWLGSSRNLWIRNNVSTITSQFIDSTIFITIAFNGTYDNIVSMIIAQWIVKCVIALIDTPFAYWARAIINPNNSHK